MTTDRSVQNTAVPYQDDDEIDLMDLFMALWKQKWVIVICAALFVAAGTTFALLTPKTYEAKTSLLILPPIPAEITGSGQDGTNSGVSPNMYAVFAPDIYKDLAVAHDLLQEAIAAAYPEEEDRPAPKNIEAGIKVGVNKSSEERGAAARQSLTLTVTLRGGEPEKLAEFLTAWSNSFIRKNSQLFMNRAAQSFEYLRETFASVQKDLVAAEDALFSFRKQNPTSVLSIQLETMKTLHGEFLAQYTKNIRSLAPLEAKAKAIREFLSSEPERISISRGMTKDSLWAFLAQRLAPGELEHLKELNITDELLNSHHQTLKAKLYDLNAEIAALKVSIADLRQHIDSTEKEFNEKQTRLLEISLETERLSREEKVLQESYNTLATKFQVSRVAIAEAADPIRVIEQPVLPTSPVAPRKTLIVALSGVLGLFIGIFAALIVNMVKNRTASAKA